MNVSPLYITVIVLCLATTLHAEADCECGPPNDPGAVGISALENRPPTAREIEVPRLDLFVMSLCPYGMAAEREIIALIDQLQLKFRLIIHHIGDDLRQIEDGLARSSLTTRTSKPATADKTTTLRNGCTAATSAGTGRFRSLHGQPEIDEGRRQVVITKHYPQSLHNYLLCRNEVKSDWRRCAQSLGIDTTDIGRRARGIEGEELFAAALQLGNQLGINLSPTLYIDGAEYTGRIETSAIARGLCESSPEAPACAQIGICGNDDDCPAIAEQVTLCRNPNSPQAHCKQLEPVSFGLTVLHSTECGQCNNEGFLATTRELFPGVVVRRLDIAQAPDWFDHYEVQQVPTYIFDAAFAGTARFERVRHLLQPRGGHFFARPDLAAVTYWPLRGLMNSRLDLFVPATALTPGSGTNWLLELEQRILEAWSERRPAMFDVHFVGPAPDSAKPELARRLCVAADVAQYGAYVAVRNPHLSAQENNFQDEDNAAKAVVAAGKTPEQVTGCVEAERWMERFHRSARRADSLGIGDGQTISALINNRIFVRDTTRRMPEELARLGI